MKSSILTSFFRSHLTQESEKQLLQQLLKQQEKPELQEYKTKIKIYDTKIKKTGKGFTPLPVFFI